MNEDISRKNDLKRYLNSLKTKEFITGLGALVLQYEGGSVSICFPVHANVKKDLHIMINTEKAMNANKMLELTGKVKSLFDFDYTLDEGDEITVHFKHMYRTDRIDSLFEEQVVLSDENFKDGVIGKFFDKYYPSFLDSPQGNKKVSSGEGSPRKIELNEMLATFEEFKKTASAEEVERFTKAVMAQVSGQNLTK